ncbi:SusD/RagB family nutrient-binding outer membrane lipoprotein [Muribaculum sp.]|uniref:SusD/RagB family nutrient-binding outer membrane lipoprotein n=1 Tax=Muribaculum sp. TaxID=1918611 RepID=UPI0023BC1E55|nr:SusD/RagB family nutrient-binding outer membrane lipoprotein [Muribaculum sp.]MDE5704992.1 SusD/RagB family nutrient-binding outer membrane lipoprotein [Muribaculum sp.]
MKNQIYSAVLCSVLAGGVLSSCTDSFNDWNTNPNEATFEEMNRDNLLTGSNYATMQRGIFIVNDENGNGVYQRTQSLTADLFSGYLANIKPSYDIGDIHHDHYFMVSHWYNAPFEFANTKIMEPYRQICRYADEASVDRAMATVLRVFGMHRVTDKYGPIVYSKFGSGIQVGYDSQKDIYTSFFNELDEAINILGEYVDLNPGKNYLARYDHVYDGDVRRWVKFANTLRLRLAMRVSYVDKALATQQANAAINEVHGLMSSVADDAVLHQGNGLTFTNPLWETTQSWPDQRISATIDCYMNGYEDPRLSSYFTKNEKGLYRGARNGMTKIYSSVQTRASGINVGQYGDMPWMKHAEAYFLMAEAKLRLGVGDGSVKELYERGVRASMESAGVATDKIEAYLESEALPLESWSNPNVRSDNENEQTVSVKSMLSQVSPKFDDTADAEKQLEQIITQKWIALFPDGMEAWSEIRRTGYPGWVRIETYANTSEVADNDIIRRLRFPSSEYSNNAANVSEAVRLLGGADNAGTHLWWDVK